MIKMFKKKYLLADIGGTYTRLAIVDNDYKFIKKDQYLNSEIKDIMLAIEKFCLGEKIDAGCLAIAGLINNDRSMAHLTNMPWEINVNILSKKFNAKIRLLNDFEALGLSIDTLKPENYVELNNKGINFSGTITLIGAGTGLGLSILYEYNNKHYPLLSEGGHSSVFFNIESKLEIEFFKFLKKQKKVIDLETVVSGKGIVNIYEFLLTKKIKHNKKICAEIKKSNDKSSLISKYALQDRDFLCLKTMQLFILFYSRAARDFALSTMCTTLVIGGGISPKILPLLKEMFVESFVQHERIEYRKILENISVIVLTEPELAYKGCYSALK